MKCRSRIDEHSVSEYEHALLLEGPQFDDGNKDEMIKEFLRKNFLKFYVNVYKDQNQGTRSSASSSAAGDDATARYMLDVHLFKGTVCVFMDFVRKFLHVMSQAVAQTNSCCSSSRSSVVGEGRSRAQSDYNLKLFI